MNAASSNLPKTTRAIYGRKYTPKEMLYMASFRDGVEAAVMELFAQGLTQAEIGRRIGKPPMKVRQLLGRGFCGFLSVLGRTAATFNVTPPAKKKNAVEVNLSAVERFYLAVVPKKIPQRVRDKRLEKIHRLQREAKKLQSKIRHLRKDL